SYFVTAGCPPVFNYLIEIINAFCTHDNFGKAFREDVIQGRSILDEHLGRSAPQRGLDILFVVKNRLGKTVRWLRAALLKIITCGCWSSVFLELYAVVILLPHPACREFARVVGFQRFTHMLELGIVGF